MASITWEDYIVFSPFRDHTGVGFGPFGRLMRVLDRPINRFILDMFSYSLFLGFLLMSVIHGVSDYKKRDSTW